MFLLPNVRIISGPQNKYLHAKQGCDYFPNKVSQVHYASVPQRRKTYTEKQAGTPWQNKRLTCSLRCLHLTIETTRTEKLPITLWVHKKRQSVKENQWILCKMTKDRQITWATATKSCSFGIINQTKIPYRNMTMFIPVLWLNSPKANEEKHTRAAAVRSPLRETSLPWSHKSLSLRSEFGSQQVVSVWDTPNHCRKCRWRICRVKPKTTASNEWYATSFLTFYFILVPKHSANMVKVWSLETTKSF